jgi:hypothetical protein
MNKITRIALFSGNNPCDSMNPGVTQPWKHKCQTEEQLPNRRVYHIYLRQRAISNIVFL